MSIPILYATSVNKLTAVESIDTFQVNANVYLSGGVNLLDILSGGGGGTGRDDVNTLVIENSASWNTAYNVATAYQSVSGNFVNTTILNSVSSLLLPTSVYQNASGNWQGTFTTVQSNSSNWNQAYSTATVYQANSSSYATNSLVNSVSSLLTPLTLTNTLTGQLVTNTAFTNYQTSVASSTATLLPTSIYQQASGNWQDAYTNLVTNSAAYLSGVDLTFLQEPSANWNSTYTTVQTNSSNWQNAYNTATVYQTNSSSYATTNYVNDNFFPLSGGVISGPTRINNNLTVFGNLTATGTTTFANTIFSVTSSLSVVHVGSGPALYVGNNGDGDIASFYDIDQGIEILHVGGINSSFPNVGIKVSSPNKTLTVAGEISATQDITTSGKFYIQNDGNSDQWNQAYNISTAYQSASSSFATNSTVDSVSSLLTPLTLTNTLTSQLVTNTIFSNYQTSVGSATATLLPTSVYQSASGSFATIAFTDSKYLPLSGGTITGNLNVQGQILSGGINISQLLSSSGGGGGDPAVNTVVYTTSATWNNTTTVVQNNSASWFEPVRRFDYVTVANVDISYSGTAPFGTADTNPIWKVIRLTYANNGTISNSASAIDSWTGRLTAAYV